MSSRSSPRTRILGACAAAVLGLALAGCAVADLEGDARGVHESAIKNANPTEATAYPEVVLLSMLKDKQGSPNYRCTGVLLSNRAVLTAEHCMKGFEAWVAQGVYGEARSVVASADTWEVHDDAGSQPSTSAHDVGVICLSAPGIRIKTKPALAAKGQVGKDVYYLGRTDNGTITNKIWMSPKVTLTASPFTAYGTFKHHYGGPELLEGADSGGPVFPADGSHEVVGVNSGGCTRLDNLARSALLSKVDDITAWITKRVRDCDADKGLKNPALAAAGGFDDPARPRPAQCRVAVVTAGRDYHPRVFRDGSATFLPELGFRLPSEVHVTAGNAGNQPLTLAFSFRQRVTSCRYVGGAPVKHPKRPEDVAAGSRYRFTACSDGTAAGSLVLADYLTVRVVDGDGRVGSTDVELVLEEVDPCGPTLDGGARPDLSAPLDLSAPPDLLARPDAASPCPIAAVESGGSVTLTARKSYGPSAWCDGEWKGSSERGFTVPRVLDVTSGNAGNHCAELRLHAAAGAIKTCTYRGGSDQAHPNSPEQTTRGRRYVFETCFDGPGDCGRQPVVDPNRPDGNPPPSEPIPALRIVAHVDNGDSYVGATQIEAVLAK